MHIRIANVLPAALLATLAACQCNDCCSDSTPQQAAPAQMSPEEAMAKTMELATPGAEHQRLAQMVGTWTNHYKMRWGPNEPWQEFDGTSEHELVLGGRYLQEDVSFEMMGMPMKGLQLLGYDRMSGEYTSLWADSMSTWWVEARGHVRPDHVIEFKGTMRDVAGERPYRMTVEHKGPDEVHMEMFDFIPPQGDFLTMTIDSRRKQ